MTKKTATEEINNAGPEADDALKEAQKPGPQIPLDDLVEEASYAEPDYIFRQTLRGEELTGNADDRDVAGLVDFEDTPHGREDRKNKIERGHSKDDRR